MRVPIRAWRVARLVAVVLLCGAASYGLVAARYGQVPRVPSLIDALAAATRDTSESLELWYFFRPSDCHTGRAPFDTLSALQMSGRVRVRAIMLEPPVDSVVAEVFATQFSSSFRVDQDRNHAWARLLRTNGIRPPAFVVRRGAFIDAIAMHASVGSATSVLLSVLGDTALLDSLLHSERPDVHFPRHFLTSHFVLAARSPPTGAARVGDPALLTLGNQRAYVYDYSDRRVHAFGLNGNLVWVTAGASITGFQNPTDLRWDGLEVVVSDPAAEAVTLIDSIGHVKRVVRLTKRVQQFLPLRAGLWVGFDEQTTNGRSFLFDSSGRVVDSLASDSISENVPFQARYMRIAGLYGSDSAVGAYQVAGGLEWFDLKSRRRRSTPGIEPVPFPVLMQWKSSRTVTIQRVDPAALKGAIDVTTDQRHVYVLFGGATDYFGRIVDIYSRGTGHYVGSVLLPSHASYIARSSEGFVIISQASNVVPARIEYWRGAIQFNGATH